MITPNNVSLEGWYGGDITHAMSAWTSTRRELTEERKTRIGQLLGMLAQSDPAHTTPFEKSSIHFIVDAETASHIQMIKHRIAVSINAESARYKEHKEDKYYIPPDWPKEWQDNLDRHCYWCFQCYHDCLRELEPMLGRKRAKESARFFLPYASSLRFDVMFNFSSFMHFFELRHSEHAQEEIQDLSGMMMTLLVEATHDFDLSLVAFGIDPEGFRR